MKVDWMEVSSVESMVEQKADLMDKMSFPYLQEEEFVIVVFHMS